MSHAELSASGSEIWVNCAGSVQAQRGLPDVSHKIARQGTVIHHIADRMLSVGELTEEGEVFTVDGHEETVYDWMINMALEYCDFVTEEQQAAERELLHAEYEMRVNFSYLVTGGFGTADAVLIYIEDGKRVLHVIDLKTGYIPVYAEANKQLALYALGTMDTLSWEFPIEQYDEVRLTIYATRNGGEDTWYTSVNELQQYAKRFAAASREALSDKPSREAGDHCYYCKALPICSAARDHAMSNAGLEYQETDDTWVIGDLTMREPSELDADDLAKLLPHIDAMIQWADKVKDHARKIALEGEDIAGHKLIYGRAKRKQWRDEIEVEQLLLEMGFDIEDIYEETMLTPTKMLKILDKDKAETILPYIEQPDPDPVLVPAKARGREYQLDPTEDFDVID